MELHDITENQLLDMEIKNKNHDLHRDVVQRLIEWIKMADKRIIELEEDNTTTESYNEGHDDGWQVGYDACLEKHAIEEDDE